MFASQAQTVNHRWPLRPTLASNNQESLMKSAVLALLMRGFATLSFGAPRRGYTMDVPAANARSITFDV